jgi:hypothetical protein
MCVALIVKTSFERGAVLIDWLGKAFAFSERLESLGSEGFSLFEEIFDSLKEIEIRH